MAQALEREIGNANSGMAPWSEFADLDERVAKLAWPNSITVYDEMRNDAQIAALLLALILPKPDGVTTYQTVDAIVVTGNNGAWTQYTYIYSGDMNAGFLRFYCWVQSGGGSPSGSAWFDDLSIHRDCLPTPYAIGF